jgi:hypothetical protein
MADKPKKGKSYWSKTAEELAEDAAKRSRARIYLKDPLITQQTGLLNDYVVVGSDTSIREGPTSARLTVVDYDATTDTVEPPATYNEKVVDWSESKREVLWEFESEPKTRQAAQINAWATAIDTIQFFQDEQVLGRDIQWGFDGGRLRILPHAMYEPNAFYSRKTRALHFGYFRGSQKGSDEIRTSLCHDIVAHETSHAILDGIRPHYMGAMDLDTLAFHEFIGDLGAMLSLFRNREGLAQIIRAGEKKRTFLQLISDLAPEVAKGLYNSADRSFLRSAKNLTTYADAKKSSEIHFRSQVLSGFAFDLLNLIYNTDVKNKWNSYALRGKTDQEKMQDLLDRAARTVGCMLLAPLDYLPPDSIDFVEYAAIILALDTLAYPDDFYHYRDNMKLLMRERRILPPSQTLDNLWKYYALQRNERWLIERNINMIRGSRMGAYRFLDANRVLFGIPAHKDFRVIGVVTNQRKTGVQHKPPPLTFIQYGWDEYLTLPKDLKSSAVDEVVFCIGGTVAVDDNVNLVFWVPPKNKKQVQDQYQDRLQQLFTGRQIDMHPVPGLRSAHSFLLEPLEGGVGRINLNAARMHADRQ